jgi:hypothetical protein
LGASGERFARGHGQRQQLAVGEVRRHRAERDEGHRHMAAQHVVDGGRDALVRHVRQLGAGGAGEHLAQDVHRRAAARAGVASDFALGGGHGVLQAGEAAAAAGHQEQRLAAGLHDGREAVEHVVAAGAAVGLQHQLAMEKVLGASSSV